VVVREGVTEVEVGYLTTFLIVKVIGNRKINAHVALVEWY
jgi:hypothetical protein